MNKLFLLLLGFMLILNGCQQKADTPVSQNTRFLDYISGITTGMISRKDNLTVQFTSLVSLPESVSDDWVKLDPPVKGSLVRSGQSLIFSPEEALESGEDYTVRVDLGAISDAPEELKEFVFAVQTIEQDYEIELEGLRTADTADPGKLELTGSINTADYIENEEAEKMLKGMGEEIEWIHSTSTSHRFTIKGIERKEDAYEVKVSVSGNPIGVKKSADRSLTVPSVKEFAVTSTRVNEGSNAYVSLLFSDPIQTNQDLKGLIELDGEANPRFVIDGNEIQIYLTRMLSGSRALTIASGIKNVFGHPLPSNIERQVAFDPEKPQIKLLGKGTILPSTDGLVLPFEAVSLQRVRVDVTQVFEQNIPQFLQTNDLNGSDQIRRTGRKVMSTSVDLTERSSDLSNWNRFTLDLSSLFSAEKGAIYRVSLSFRPEDSVFPCDETFSETYGNKNLATSWSIFDDDGFNSWGDYSSYYYPPGYRWDQRENPCHVSYFNRQRFVTRSLIASDIGLIAKIGGDNSLNVFTTNMVSASPVNANITILDYQLQVLDEGTTDGNGSATFNPVRRPFLVIAESDGQKSYLKLDDGSSLSMSNFDVSGSRVRGGIKGFIYGERGVWRPGNDIYLSFMLEDIEGRIPVDHPVIFELRDPTGNLKDRQVADQGVEGLYLFKTKTEATDVTGNWSARVSVGNSSFNKTVKIETIKPNRLKIDLDFGTEKVTFSDRSLSPTLSVNWLTGLKGNNLKAETELRFQPVNTTFDGYGNFEFDQPGKSYYSDKKVIFSGNTDEEGQVTFNYELPSETDAPGALRAVFNTKAFEPGGNFSIHSKTLRYYPYESFVGIRIPEGDEWGYLKQGAQHQMNIVVLDSEGNPVPSRRVDLKIYRINWRWWWDESEDYSVNYVRNSNQSLKFTKSINVQDGKGTANFSLDRWGRYIAIVEDPVSGHSSGDFFYMGWSADEPNELGASFLQVTANKEAYEVGEEIELTIPGTTGGQALVSIENGSRVVENFWTETKDGQTIVKVEATPDMTPNVYAHITFLQPHAQTKNDLPIRLYGLAPVSVFDKQTILEPEISMKDELAPGKEVTIKVSEKNNKPMAYTIAVVDEGLLDITGFKTPNPWNHFYRREAIGVKTWDIYDDVIGAFGGRLERLLAIGGDGEAEGDEDGKKKPDERFKPVVQFMGPFFTTGKSQTHTFTMPQYIGSVKTMVVAGMEGAYGKAEKATPVIKPLMVLGTLPRVTGPGEKVRLPVNVFRYKDNIKDATVTIETEGLVKVNGTSSATVDLSSAQSMVAFFDLEVEKALGTGKVTITAKSGRETAVHQIPIVSRAPNTEQTQVKLFTIAAGKTHEELVNTFGMTGTNTATLEIASVPSINLEKRLRYLIRYPHGCIEQTVSSVFPQLFLSNISELSSEQRIRIEENIKKGISRLGKFQTHEGGFSYWPGYSDPNSWGTNYGYHFLIEAEKKGFFVPKELMQKLKKYQKQKAKNWSKGNQNYNDDLIQAYRLFTLALTGDPSLSSMNRMLNTPAISHQAKWRLGAAYSLTGKASVAEELLNQPVTNNNNYSYYYTYGSSERDQAMLLETYTYLGKQQEGFKVLRDLATSLSSDRWYSTQTTAYTLLAISKYLGEMAKDNQVDATVTYGGTSDKWFSELPIVRSSLDAEASDKKLTLANNSNGTLFVTITTTGTPFPGDEPESTSGISVSIDYFNQDGERIEVSSIRQGQTFEAAVRVDNKSTNLIKDVALSQIFPSGWEINNDRLNDDPYSNSSFDFQDIRDDRIYTYFDLKRGGSKTFTVKLTAAYGGRFYLPGAYCEAMYDASLNAKTKGQWIDIGE